MREQDEVGAEQEVSVEEFGTIWQSKPVKIGLGVGALVVVGAALMWLDVRGWGKEQVTGVGGEANVLARVVEEDYLSPTPMGQLHERILPDYLTMMMQNGEEDPRVVELLERAKEMAGDEELAATLDEMHAKLAAGSVDLRAQEEAWNERMQELGEPYAMVGGSMDDGHDHGGHDHGGEGREEGRQEEGDGRLYMPELHRIEATVQLEVDGKRREVEWRERLDGFRRAGMPTFYDAEAGRSWVRTDRAWGTVWGVLSGAVLTDEDWPGSEEEVRFGWRDELRQEVREALGEEGFGALIRGSVRQMELREVAGQIAARGNRCGQRYRIVRIPWMGFDSQALERMEEMARMDRQEECPRMTEEEAAMVRRISRALQADGGFGEVMPRLLALFLVEKSYMAAAFQARATDETSACEACEWTEIEAAEVGGYLTGVLQGPYPMLGLVKLCFGHRYGSPASYRGWLLMLRAEGFECRGVMPADLLERLAERETAFSAVGSMRLVGEVPETVQIKRWE